MIEFLFALATLASVNSGTTPAPIACQPKALDPAQRKRQQALLRTLQGRVQETKELPDGYAFRLPTDPALFQEGAEWVSLERRCCPFLAFALEWREDDTVWVRATGGPGAKAALAAEMGIKAR